MADNLFADCKIKDYEIEVDGEKYLVKNERWLGIVHRKDGIVLNEDVYFEGYSFDWDEENKTWVMSGLGDFKCSLEEFNKRVKRVTYFK